MILLRSLVYFLVLSVSIVIFTLILVLLGWLLDFAKRSRITNTWGKFNLWALDRICHLRYEIIGAETIEYCHEQASVRMGDNSA